MGKVIADDDYTDLLMSSLPPSYENARSSINASAHLNPTKLTPDALQLYMLDEYEVRMLKDKKESKDEAFTADTTKKKSKKDIECHNCRKRGHVKANCWAKGGGKEGQGPRRNRGATAGAASQAEEQSLEAWAAIEEVECTEANPRTVAAAMVGSSPA